MWQIAGKSGKRCSQSVRIPFCDNVNITELIASLFPQRPENLEKSFLSFSPALYNKFFKIKTYTNWKKKKKEQIYTLQVFLHKQPNWKQKESLTECHNLLFTLQEFYQILTSIISYVTPRYFLSSHRVWYLKRCCKWRGVNWLGCHRKEYHHQPS